LVSTPPKIRLLPRLGVTEAKIDGVNVERAGVAEIDPGLVVIAGARRARCAAQKSPALLPSRLSAPLMFVLPASATRALPVSDKCQCWRCW